MREDTGRCWLSVLRDTRRPEEVRPELMELSREMAREGAVSISMVANSAASLGFSASQSQALQASVLKWAFYCRGSGRGGGVCGCACG